MYATCHGTGDLRAVEERYDAIIVGRGLAGIVLSETLLARGKRVMVFDMAKPHAASRVAAGVVNPVAMRRVIASWRAAELMPLAMQFYRALEERYGARLWHPVPLVRLFASAREAIDWRGKHNDATTAPFLADGEEAAFNATRFHAEHGYGRIPGCAWLDVPQLLRAHKEHWLAMDALSEVEVRPEDVLRDGSCVRVHGKSAPWLIWCSGPFQALPGLVPTRGDVLSFADPVLDCKVMVHRSGFLLPVGGHRYKVGSTFAWTDVWGGTTASAREELLRKAAAILRTPPAGPFAFECGVRPAARDRRPILGQVLENQAVLNGLGSRGALVAPWCAEHLIAHLFDGQPLDPEVDIARFHEE